MTAPSSTTTRLRLPWDLALALSQAEKSLFDARLYAHEAGMHELAGEIAKLMRAVGERNPT